MKSSIVISLGIGIPLAPMAFRRAAVGRPIREPPWHA